MIGFDPISLPALFLLAGMSGSCPNFGAPTVDVTISASDAPLDTSMTHQELTAGFANNPDSSLATEPGWHLGGLTLSQIENLFSSNFQQALFPDGTACTQISDVNIDIVYTPVIYVASDYMSNRCRYTVTLAHEQRHVGTDLQVFNDYAPYLKKKIQAYVNQISPQGPFDQSQLQMVQDAMLAEVQRFADPLMEQMIETRRQMQAQFDTQSNYEREGAMCADEGE
ncbi:MAG: hypothetical protein PSY14_03145 [bacterium]|nr:hypothetical protein [bacterium]